MQKNEPIVKHKENFSSIQCDNENSLSKDIANEMKKGYNMVMDVIEKMNLDTRVEIVEDDEGNRIGQRTQVNPQLLRWIEEARKYQNDMWKLGGGEIAQEKEKEKIKLEAKLIMELLSANPEKRKEMKENWKKSANFKS